MPPRLSATAATLIFLILITATTKPTASQATATTQDPDLESECKGRWIHIRHLPPRFNVDLLSNCSSYPVFSDNFCPYLSNHGLGRKTHDSTRSWYRTDPFMLELIFHRRMLEYPCLTPDPTLSDAVYLPYYAAIDSLRYLFGPDQNSSSQHGLDLFRYLLHHSDDPVSGSDSDSDSNLGPDIWRRNFGHDHFLVMARPAWDFSKPLSEDPPIFGTSFLELPEFFNVTALTLEARAYPWQEQAIPYPTSFHPPNLSLFESWVSRVRKSKRSSLMMFAGGGGISANPNIRRSIRLECDNSSSSDSGSSSGGGLDSGSSSGGGLDSYDKLCDFVDCSSGVCEHDPIRFMKPMLRSSFCLQPPGDTPTRRSTFDAIIAGCIPVFFEEMSAKKQYGWHLPVEEYENFSVFIRKEDVVYKGVKVVDVLMSIPRDKVRRMRENVVELIPRVMYRKHESSLGLRSKKDAIDIAIEGTLKRIKARKIELQRAAALSL